MAKILMGYRAAKICNRLMWARGRLIGGLNKLLMLPCEKLWGIMKRDILSKQES